MRVQNKWSLAAAALFILLGISLIIWPLGATTFIYNTLGVLILVYGSTKIIGYFKSEESDALFQFDVVLGVVAAVLGLLLIFATQMFVSLLPILMGIFLIVEGVLKIRPALDLREVGYANWWWALIVAAVVLCCGVFLIINPFAGASIAAIFLGVSLIVDGVSTIGMNILYRKTIKTSEKEELQK